jgi:hypothetical protein
MTRTNPVNGPSRAAARNIIVMGAISTVITTGTLIACGQIEIGNAAQPLNAISHIIWGDTSATMQTASLKYTATGLLLHTMAMVMWSTFYEFVFGRLIGVRARWAVFAGVAVSVIAYLTDYYVVPDRLSPGFEKVLSPQSTFAVFGALAASLAFGQLLSSGQVRHESPNTRGA